MRLYSLNNYLKRYFGSVNVITRLEDVTKKFIEHIDKYKKEKNFSIKLYRNQKKELKDCFNNLFDKELNTLNEKELIVLFTKSILLCRRIQIPKEGVTNILRRYVTLKKEKKSEEDAVVPLSAEEYKNSNSNRDEIVLVAKCIRYLNIEYDKVLFNYVYMEWNNAIELYTIEELTEIVNLISSFKKKNWINQKFFARCISEIIKKSNESFSGNRQLPFFLVALIKSSAKVGYDIDNIKALLDLFTENYKHYRNGRREEDRGMEIMKEDQVKDHVTDHVKYHVTDHVKEHIEEQEKQETEEYDGKNKNSYNMATLIKVLYNLFLCNYYNSKVINPLINLLKEELFPKDEEEDYPLQKKYLFNDNLVIDNNFDYSSEFSPESNYNIFKNRSPSTPICNDNLNSIHEIYFNSPTKDKLHTLKPADTIKSINLYRLKFVDMIIRSDSYLYNLLYSPNAHFWDFIKQLRYEVEKHPKETIFSRQVTFFLKEHGFQLKCKPVDIYQVFVLPTTKKVCVELVHSVFVNKGMKDSPNRFHKNNLNYKIRYLKFLGWNILLFYEHEWKQLRNYEEKYNYVKKTLQNIKATS